jgi:hypothetical protein
LSPAHPPRLSPEFFSQEELKRLKQVGSTAARKKQQELEEKLKKVWLVVMNILYPVFFFF